MGVRRDDDGDEHGDDDGDEDDDDDDDDDGDASMCLKWSTWARIATGTLFNDIQSSLLFVNDLGFQVDFLLIRLLWHT